MKRGKLVIISGPSGAGKTTLVKQLLENCLAAAAGCLGDDAGASRPGEKHAVDYYFLSPEEFRQKREGDEFLECFEVFGRGYWYGTLRDEVVTGLAAGRWVLLEIDVQGMAKVVSQHPEAISFFVRPASLAELERRLRGRGTETEETIQRRLDVAQYEWQSKDQYTYEIVNESLDEAVSEICNLLMRSTEH